MKDFASAEGTSRDKYVADLAQEMVEIQKVLEGIKVTESSISAGADPTVRKLLHLQSRQLQILIGGIGLIEGRLDVLHKRLMAKDRGD